MRCVVTKLQYCYSMIPMTVAMPVTIISILSEFLSTAFSHHYHLGPGEFVKIVRRGPRVKAPAECV